MFLWSGVLHFFVLLSYPIISVGGQLSPYDFEMLSISPQQAYSFVVDFLNNSSQSFLLSSVHSILSILPEALRCLCCQVSFHLVKFMFFSFHFQPECCLNPFSLIRFLSRSNRCAFIVYLIPWAFNSRHSRRSSLLLECSRFFASSLQFLLHLIPFSLPSRS